jgi:hypothetical protein
MNIILAFLLYACTVVFCSLLLYSSTKITKKFPLDCQNGLYAALQSGNQQVFNDYFNSLDLNDQNTMLCVGTTYLECNGNEQYPKIYIKLIEPANWSIPIPDLPDSSGVDSPYYIYPKIIDIYNNIMSFQCQIRIMDITEL